MVNWFRKYFRKNETLKVEVNIHVPEVHVFVHGSREGRKETGIPQDRPGTQAAERGITFSNAPTVSDEEQLDLFKGKLQDLKIPQTKFGEDK